MFWLNACLFTTLRSSAHRQNKGRHYTLFGLVGNFFFKRLAVGKLGVFRDASPSMGSPQHEICWYSFIHLGCLNEVSFPRTCNTMSLARSRLQTSLSVGERTSHNATAPPTSSRQTFTFRITILKHSNQNVFYVCGLKLC